MKKIAVVLLVLVAAVAAWGYSIWPREATVFAEQFDRQAFTQLPIGAAMSDASKQLGRPLTSRTFALRERWLYCLSDRQPMMSNRGMLTSTGEMAVDDCPAIEFDQGGRVAGVTRLPETLKGSDAAIVRSTVGAPAVIRKGGTLTVWYYSRPKSENDTYEQITLTFDERGRLVDKNVSVIAD